MNPANTLNYICFPKQRPQTIKHYIELSLRNISHEIAVSVKLIGLPLCNQVARNSNYMQHIPQKFKRGFHDIKYCSQLKSSSDAKTNVYNNY